MNGTSLSINPSLTHGPRFLLDIAAFDTFAHLTQFSLLFYTEAVNLTESQKPWIGRARILDKPLICCHLKARRVNNTRASPSAMGPLAFIVRLVRRPRHKLPPVYLPRGVSAAKDEQFLGPGGRPLAVSSKWTTELVASSGS